MVVLDREERKRIIANEAVELAAAEGLDLKEDAGLLDEVAGLVEWPVVYAADFDKEFLSVPQECLILTMRTNQKYFPLFDNEGSLTNRFLLVSNMEVANNFAPGC